MCDNLKRYFAIKKALKQFYPGGAQGNLARHLDTLAFFVSGIVAAGSTALSKIAASVPQSAKPNSRIRRLERWMDNKRIEHKTFYLPYLRLVLESLMDGPLVVVMDGSLAGRNCVLLSPNLVYKKRAIPLCWSVVKGKKGHLPVEMHLELLQAAADFLPPQRSVIFLGDGEFDGVERIGAQKDLGWNYVCRTARNIQLREGGEKFSPNDLMLKPGDEIELPDVMWTQEEYGPVLIGIVWKLGCKDPIVLVSNFDLLEEAFYWYQLRFKIETFFSDQKSRGFFLHKSHISDTQHLNRLLIGTCLAYLWIVCLGALVVERGWLPLIHRNSRCDWSLFRIGLEWLIYCLNEDRVLPVLFRLPREGIRSLSP